MEANVRKGGRATARSAGMRVYARILGVNSDCGIAVCLDTPDGCSGLVGLSSHAETNFSVAASCAQDASDCGRRTGYGSSGTTVRASAAPWSLAAGSAEGHG